MPMKLTALMRYSGRPFWEKGSIRLKLQSISTRGRERSCRCSKRTYWRRKQLRLNLAKDSVKLKKVEMKVDN